MAKFISKNSDFYLREKDIMINTPSLVAVGIDNSIYINVDIKEIITKEVRYDFKGIMPIHENIDFNELDILNCYFSFNHHVKTKNINISIKESRVMDLSFKGKDKFNYDLTQDLIDFNIENSDIDNQIFLFSKKLIINAKEVKSGVERILEGHLAEKIVGYIFYYGNEIRINTHHQKIDYILPYIEYLRANQEFQKSMIEEYSEKIIKSKERIINFEKSIKELINLMQ